MQENLPSSGVARIETEQIADTGHNGEASAVGAAERPGFAPLVFDADEFIQYVKDHDLSAAEAYEFLATVWVYVVTWVDLSFGIHRTQLDIKKNAAGTERVLDHESALVLACRETFNDRTNEKTARRPKRSAGRKDSRA